MIRRILSPAVAVLAITFVVSGADVTGKWVAQVAGQNGNQQMTFALKADGNTLTGTVTGGGGGRGGRRGGGGGSGAAQAREVSDGKIDGDKVSFTVKTENNGRTRVTTYSGTITGDTLQLKQSREGRNGAQTTDITAKRSTT
jgi:hypothetical protein